MTNYTYPKALMTVKELQDVGYPRQILDEIAHMQGGEKSIAAVKRARVNNPVPDKSYRGRFGRMEANKL